MPSAQHFLFRQTFFGIAVLAVFCLCLVTVMSRTAWAEGSPLESLHLAQRGVDECNADYFNQAVDLPSVVDKAASAMLAALSKQAEEGNLGDGGLAMAVGMLSTVDENAAALLRPLLVSEVRGFINSGINGGYFAGKPNGSVKPRRGTLASTLEKMPPGRRQILPGKVLSQKDELASVSAFFIDPEAGSFPLILAMQRENGLWRVKEISNAQELFDEASRRDNQGSTD